jgi:hemerythrin
MKKTRPEHRRRIEWDDSLSIGNETIDWQHKTLIERLQAVAEAIDMNQGEGTIAKTLDFLLDYAGFHFSEEEKLMEENHYPGLGLQKQQHEEFRQDVNKLVEDFMTDGASKDIANHIRDFLFIWLKKHIIEVDLQLGKFLAEKTD